MPVFLLLIATTFNPSALTVDLSTVPIEHATTTRDLMAIATSSAAAHGLTQRQTRRMLATVQCESGWDVNAVGPLGEIGLVQFYPRAHTNISKTQMRDPYFSLDWMAARFEEGQTQHWVCYTQLYGP